MEQRSLKYWETVIIIRWNVLIPKPRKVKKYESGRRVVKLLTFSFRRKWSPNTILFAVFHAWRKHCNLSLLVQNTRVMMSDPSKLLCFAALSHDLFKVDYNPNKFLKLSTPFYFSYQNVNTLKNKIFTHHEEDDMVLASKVKQVG